MLRILMKKIHQKNYTKMGKFFISLILLFFADSSIAQTQLDIERIQKSDYMDVYCMESDTKEECVLSIVRTSNGFVVDFNEYFNNQYKFRMYMQTDNNVDMCQIMKADMPIDGQNPLHTTTIKQKKNSGHWQKPLGISFGFQAIDNTQSNNVIIIDIGNQQMLILKVFACRFFGEKKSEVLINKYVPNQHPIEKNFFIQFIKQIENRLIEHGAELK